MNKIAVADAIVLAPEGKLPAFTSFGCYPLVYVDDRGGCLCAKCATKLRDKGTYSDGRLVTTIAYDVHWEGEPLECEECEVEIESAYGVPD